MLQAAELIDPMFRERLISVCNVLDSLEQERDMGAEQIPIARSVRPLLAALKSHVVTPQSIDSCNPSMVLAQSQELDLN